MPTPLTFTEVLAEESAKIGLTPPAGGARLAELYRYIHGLPDEVAPRALCLSGGGIRSATFALGVMQGLARLKLLPHFDYLSTVSGGGYIGSWLTAWLKNNPPDSKPVMDALEQSSGDPAAPEPKPVRHLREYSNYLSPRLGLFSADTWTLATIFVRNLVLNWMMLLPMLAGALLVPGICVAFLQAAHPSNRWFGWVIAGGLLVGLGLGVWAISRVPRYLPSLRSGPSALRSEAHFVASHIALLAGSVVALTTTWYYFNKLPVGDAFPGSELFWRLWQWNEGALYFVVLGVALHTLGWVIGVRPLARLDRKMWAAVVLGGGMGGGLVWKIASWFRTLAGDPVFYVTVASPLLIGLLFAAGIVFVGLASFREMTQDPDREWWARAGGWLLIVSAVWLAFCILVLYLPYWLLWTEEALGGAVKAWYASVGGAASGAIAAWVGWSAKSARTAGKVVKRAMRIAVQVAEKILAPVFAAAVAASLSMLLTRLLLDSDFDSPQDHFDALLLTPWWQLALVALGLFLFGYGIGRVLSVNRFSLHAMYRNRLIRAYLGASRARRPDPLTGFDERDNWCMDDLRSVPRPLHILNLTLNLTTGEELAWQQRKAQSFTASCLHAGYADADHAAYQYSRDYTDAGGLSLGTAVTISGAAASPNMGYHSSKILTFLMALFNARLGAWLPNPSFADPKILGRGGPDSPLVLLREAFGMADRRYPWIYLSDGGHFENLGLYEMVRRRCRWIVVSDASADPHYTLEDLSNAVQKIRVDFGISIEFVKPPQLREAGETTGVRKHCALLRIEYADVDGPGTPPGMLLYIKPAFTGAESQDVARYAAEHPDFPQQPTSDQFFDEAQFESYRRLGQQSVEEMAKGWAGGSLRQFFAHVESVYL